MSTDSAESAERPLANAAPFLVVTGLGLVAVVALVVSLFRDPGLPAYVQDSYMRVAGGLVALDYPVRDAVGLGVTLSQAPPGSVRVPALDRQGYSLEGGTHVTLGGQPAAIAIYHNALRDLVTWHGVTGTLEDLPPTPDLRVLAGRRYAMHYKASTTIVFWQEGPMLMAVTSALPAEHVMAIAVEASSGRP
jgi:anti-sigma factor RsiW